MIDARPFVEDLAVVRLAEVMGMEVLRHTPVVITDEKAVKGAGFTCTGIDYKRLRKHLQSGATVQGASLGPMEYTLRHPSVKDTELAAE